MQQQITRLIRLSNQLIRQIPFIEEEEAKMKKTTMIQLLPMLFLIGWFLILSGCARKKERTCYPLPAKFTEAKFPFMEGGCILYDTANNPDKIMATQDLDNLELLGKYAERFKSEGWTIKKQDIKNVNLVVEKNGRQFDLHFFTGCGDNCSNFDIELKKNVAPTP